MSLPGASLGHTGELQHSAEHSGWQRAAAWMQPLAAAEPPVPELTFGPLR